MATLSVEQPMAVEEGSKKRQRDASDAEESDRKRIKTEGKSKSASSSSASGGSSSESSDSLTDDDAPRKKKKHKKHKKKKKEAVKTEEEIKKEEEEKAKISSIHTSTIGRTGGVYIPPFKMRMIEKNISDRASEQYQRLTWDALKKSLNGLVNKVSQLNIANIIPEFFSENLIRGKGLLCRSLMKSQAASPTFTNVYAAIVAVVNTKLPETGELLCKRLIAQWKKAFLRNQKALLISTTKFIAHLANQYVCGVVIPLQIIALLLDKPTDDRVEVAIEFVAECGKRLSEISPKPFTGIFSVFRAIIHEGKIDKRVQYMIENLFMIRKNQFAQHLPVIPALDLVEEGEQITHDDLNLDDDYTSEELQESFNIFHVDKEYEINEKKYDAMRKEILGDSEESGGEGSEEGEAGVEGEGEGEKKEGQVEIEDQTEISTTTRKRNIYLTIMSSLDFEECGHKLIKMGVAENHEHEVAKMLLECCAQEKTYRRFYSLLAQRFCMLRSTYRDLYTDTLFPEQYEAIHMLETNKLRNVAMFFAHLMHSDAVPWTCMKFIHLNEEETNSSKRIFIKILFKELAEFLGLKRLNERLQDKDMAEFFQYLLPKDNPKHTRFSINFFTQIGLGGLTLDMRNHLKTSKSVPTTAAPEESSSEESSSDSSSSSSSSKDKKKRK